MMVLRQQKGQQDFEPKPGTLIGDICIALGYRPLQLAMHANIKARVLKEMMEIPTYRIEQVPYADEWQRIKDFVNKKTGAFIAVREELYRRLQSTAALRAAYLTKETERETYVVPDRYDDETYWDQDV